MNDDHSTQTSPGETAGGQASETGRDYDEPVDAIRERVDGKIDDIKLRFGSIVDAEERKVAELETKHAKRRRLLVVDDAQSTEDILNGYLEGQPVEIFCTSGNRARALLDSEDYDAIMIEASVVIEPGVEGLDLCRELCGGGKVKSVIVLSSHPGDRIRESVEQAGAAFLRKPFKGLELMRLIGQMLLGEKK